MGIESIIETDFLDGSLLSSGWITPGAGAVTILTGSNSLAGVSTTFTDYTAGAIIAVEDDTGKFVYFTVASITDDFTIVTAEYALSDVTAKPIKVRPRDSVGSYYFIADNNKKASFVRNSRLTSGWIMSAAGVVNGSYFSPNEGVLLKSIYARLPYQYTLADSPLRFTLYYSYTNSFGTTVSQLITSIGEGTIGGNPLQNVIYAENIEVPINAYIPPPITENRWSIEVQLTTLFASSAEPLDYLSKRFLQISQIDGPDILNGTILPVVVGARIEHTSPVTASSV